MSAELDSLVKALQEEVKTLTESLQVKDQEVKAATDRSLRAMADLSNFQRRTEEDQKEFRDYAVSQVMKNLLPVLDHFDHALKEWEGQAKNAGSIQEGMKLVAKELWGVLTKEGLARQEVVGKMFDPYRHEAVAHVEVPKGPDGVVLEELRPGYELKGKVIRPAMVKVAVAKDANKTTEAMEVNDGGPKE